MLLYIHAWSLIMAKVYQGQVLDADNLPPNAAPLDVDDIITCMKFGPSILSLHVQRLPVPGWSSVSMPDGAAGDRQSRVPPERFFTRD